MATPTRDEHMAWCKERAHALVDEGDLVNALASLFTDLRSHENTAANPAYGPLFFQGVRYLDDPAGMRQFIEGFA